MPPAGAGQIPAAATRKVPDDGAYLYGPVGAHAGACTSTCAKRTGQAGGPSIALRTSSIASAASDLSSTSPRS